MAQASHFFSGPNQGFPGFPMVPMLPSLPDTSQGAWVPRLPRHPCSSQHPGLLEYASFAFSSAILPLSVAVAHLVMSAAAHPGRWRDRDCTDVIGVSTTWPLRQDLARSGLYQVSTRCLLGVYMVSAQRELSPRLPKRPPAGIYQVFARSSPGLY